MINYSHLCNPEDESFLAYEIIKYTGEKHFPSID